MQFLTHVKRYPVIKDILLYAVSFNDGQYICSSDESRALGMGSVLGDLVVP